MEYSVLLLKICHSTVLSGNFCYGECSGSVSGMFIRQETKGVLVKAVYAAVFCLNQKFIFLDRYFY